MIEDRPALIRFDWLLLLGILLLMTISLAILYSTSGFDRVYAQAIRFGLGFLVLTITLYLPKKLILFLVPFFYIITILLLVAVQVSGVTVNGARRWLNIGITQIQPSELAKTAIPLMLAYYFSLKTLPPKIIDLLVSGLIIGIPTALVFFQPDLGTSILVASSGIIVLFLAGISWRLIFFFLICTAIAIPIMWYFGMADYQKDRVITFLYPELDRLGKGYNIIQSKIAIGSGGLHGKGFLQGTQSQFEFLPERTTDFIFAVFSEEFGFVGIIALFVIYFYIIVRGYWMAVNMSDNFSRLLSGALLATFFIYFFINVGMVSGILPVVGLPLPLISFGGTSIMTIMFGFGLIMNFYATRDRAKKRGLL